MIGIVSLWQGTLGIICCPRADSVLGKNRDVPAGWELMACPVCGDPCYLMPLARQALEIQPALSLACTRCALHRTVGGDPSL